MLKFKTFSDVNVILSKKFFFGLIFLSDLKQILFGFFGKKYNVMWSKELGLIFGRMEKKEDGYYFESIYPNKIKQMKWEERKKEMRRKRMFHA